MRYNRAQLASLFKEEKDGSYICLVDDIIVYINKRYSNFAALSIETEVTTMGIFDIEYKGEYYWNNLPMMMSMSPTLIEDITIEAEDYLKLTFKKGDAFYTSTTLVQRADLVFAIFRLFVFFGLRYKAMTPENVSQLFFNVFMIGFNMQYTDMATVSAMFSELERVSADDIQTLYRHNPKGDSYPVGMKQISVTATKLTTKLGGSYMSATTTSALVNESTQESEIENLLRQ